MASGCREESNNATLVNYDDEAVASLEVDENELGVDLLSDALAGEEESPWEVVSEDGPGML